jgi:hypothetical protein
VGEFRELNNVDGNVNYANFKETLKRKLKITNWV